jgi:G3E family GTPase
MNDASALPVTLLTGFLGSGKTTVLNHLLRDPGLSRTAVIINELGEIGIDHDLVETATEDFVLLKSGCVCCSVRSDLIDTLRSLFLKRVRGQVAEFDRVVIETTGLADPAPILHTLTGDPLVTARYRLDGVIVTVDAANGGNTLDRAFEAVKQAAVADRIVLTKTDLVDAETVGRLMERLRRLNPAAPIIQAVNGAIDPADLFDIGLYNPATKSLDVQRWLNEEAFEDHHHHHHGADLSRHDDHINSFVFMLDHPISETALTKWLEMLVAFQGPDLLRVKGIVNVAERPGPLVIQGVQHIFHPPVPLDSWPSDDRRTRIVFITRGLDETVLRKTLGLFDRDMSPDDNLKGPRQIRL